MPGGGPVSIAPSLGAGGAPRAGYTEETSGAGKALRKTKAVKLVPEDGISAAKPERRVARFGRRRGEGKKAGGFVPS